MNIAGDRFAIPGWKTASGLVLTKPESLHKVNVADALNDACNVFSRPSTALLKSTLNNETDSMVGQKHLKR